ncbi:hypothetical protein N9L68_01410 [bacterium]|nr:hypothetical protein [bacterium]
MQGGCDLNKELTAAVRKRIPRVRHADAMCVPQMMKRREGDPDAFLDLAVPIFGVDWPHQHVTQLHHHDRIDPNV